MKGQKVVSNSRNTKKTKNSGSSTAGVAGNAGASAACSPACSKPGSLTKFDQGQWLKSNYTNIHQYCGFQQCISHKFVLSSFTAEIACGEYSGNILFNLSSCALLCDK